MNGNDGLVTERCAGASDGIETSSQVDTTALPRGASKFYLVAFAVYAGGLLALALYNGNRGEAIEMPLWDLQDTRRLVTWLSAQACIGLIKTLRFMPLGFLAPTAFAALHSTTAGHTRHLATRLLSILVPMTYSVVLQAFETGWALAFEAPVVWMVPTFFCLIGTWIGLAWLRSGWAMGALVGRLAIVSSVMLGGVIIAFWLILDSSPLAIEIVPMTSEDKVRLVMLIRKKDPRDLEPDQHEMLSLTENDLNQLLTWGMSVGSKDRKARLDLENEYATLSCSIELPGRRSARYLNFVAGFQPRFRDGRLTFRQPQMRVGRISVPRFLSKMFTQFVTYEVNQDRHLRTLLAAVDRIVVEEHQASVAYGRVDLPEGYFAEVLERLRPEGNVRGPAREYVRHLVTVVESLPPGNARFDGCMVETFRLARERSRKGDPVLENRAAIFALARLMGHYRIETFVGPLLDEPMSSAEYAAFGNVIVQDRWDWVRHFYVSAALELISNSFTSDAVGLLKEELDAGQGGSGFSFGDLLADRAGTTFAIVATRDAASARQLQDRIADRFRIADFFPKADDLPEGMSDAELTKKYGGVGGEAYLRLVEEIERRIASCAAYKP